MLRLALELRFYSASSRQKNEAISGISIRQVDQKYIVRIGKKITGEAVISTSFASLKDALALARLHLDLKSKTVDNNSSLSQA